jgi:6-phosphogluconolactonase
MLNRETCLSRRSFLHGIAGFGISCAAAGTALGSPAAGKRTLAYVGTDTTPVDGPANGKGIYLYEPNAASGELKLLKLAVETASPSWLSLHPSGNYLYAVNEVSNYEGNSGSVSAYAIQKSTGDLRHLNTVNSRGAGPAHMSIDAAGKFAFVANYFGGTIAVFPIGQDGSLAKSCFIHQDQGALGPPHALSAPPGSFAISGHDAAHAHMIQADPQNRFVLQTDLGQDRIYVYKLDSGTGQLTPAVTPFVSLPAGDGPRHFAFHPNGRWFYSIQEEASTLAFFHYDPETGSLAHQQTVSALPAGFAGTNFCSEVITSPDGRFLYAANRLHDSIGTFAIAADGKLSHLDDTPTQGDYPDHMAMEPDGRFLYVCNQRSDQITSFRVDKPTGRLTFTCKYQPLGTPMCIVFLA